MQNLLRTWASDSPSSMKELVLAIKDVDYKNISELSHMLRGSSLTISANALAKALINLETASKNNNSPNSTELFEGIQQEFEKVISLIKDPDISEIIKSRNEAQATK